MQVSQAVRKSTVRICQYATDGLAQCRGEALNTCIDLVIGVLTEWGTICIDFPQVHPVQRWGVVCETPCRPATVQR